MPNVRASSGMIGTTRGPKPSVRARFAQQAGEGHRGRHGLAARAGGELGERRVGRQGQRPADRGGARRQRPVEGPAALHQVAVLGRVHRRPVVGRLVAVERRARGSRRRGAAAARRAWSWSRVIFLIWWVALRPSTSVPERPALDRLGQDHRRGAALLGGGLVGGVELLVVVAAAGQVAQVVVATGARPACAGAGRARRSARGCRRRDSTA